MFELKKLLTQFLLHKKRRKPRLLGRENVKEKQPAPIYSVRGISIILCKHDLSKQEHSSLPRLSIVDTKLIMLRAILIELPLIGKFLNLL